MMVSFNVKRIIKELAKHAVRDECFYCIQTLNEMGLPFEALKEIVGSDADHLVYEFKKLDWMKQVYTDGLAVLREHHEETCVRVMQSRAEGRGNFAYISSPEYELIEKMAGYLNQFLWQIHCILEGKIDEEGYCNVKCFTCGYKRYNFHSVKAPDHWCNKRKEGWYCQEECECE